MVNKITNPPSQKDLIDKVNEIIDDKQDTLVSGTNIKTINNTSILGSGNIDIQSGSNYTAGTGIDITNDVISVEGVKDQRNTSTAIKTWTGTRAQYDAIVAKDSNTLYNITDDTDVSLTVLEALYPVGSVYITYNSVCPLQALGVGTWTLESTGIVTSVNTNVPIKGNGMNLGLTDGTTNVGLQVGVAATNMGFGGTIANYGGNVGVSVGISQWTSNKTMGITTDASKSGIVGTVTRSVSTINIFRRTA